ncbi:MAG: protease modulator HflC [Alphaproteobacteria bacterium]|nr:protease modulator HflC [Alphaproteobacteria bacterium]
MNRIGIWHILGVIAAAVIILVLSATYIVYQSEQAIVLQFGEPIRVVKDAGLKFKVPFVQNVVFYDARLLNLDPPAQEVVLNDKKRLDVDSFTRYKIIDPLKFYQTVRTENQARSKLAEIVNSSLRKVLGRITLTELLSEQRTQIMNDISATVKKDAEAIGVSVADVRIRRADLPREVMQAINDRMKTERQRDAKEFRAKGQQESQNIRAKADKEATIIMAEAEKNAQITRGEGDKEAVLLWNRTVGQDIEFYDFYRSLDAYRKSLSDKDTSLVLSPDSDFFKFFNKGMRKQNNQ